MQGLQVHVAVFIRSKLNDIEAGHGCGSRVGAVGAVGDGDFRAAGFAVGQVVGPDHEHAAQFAVGPGQRGQSHRRQSGYLAQETLKLVQQFQRALGLFGRLHGVNAGESRLERHFIVDLGVVLHGATAQGIEMGVYGKIQLAQAGEILDHFRLRNLGQRQVVPQQSVIG